MRLIDADAIVEKLIDRHKIAEKIMDTSRGQAVDYYSGVKRGFISAAIMVDGFPTIEPKRGKWVHGREIGRDKIGDCIIAIIYEGWECSICGCLVEESREPLYKFCPQCGADMRGDENETD